MERVLWGKFRRHLVLIIEYEIVSLCFCPCFTIVSYPILCTGYDTIKDNMRYGGTQHKEKVRCVLCGLSAGHIGQVPTSLSE